MKCHFCPADPPGLSPMGLGDRVVYVCERCLVIKSGWFFVGKLTQETCPNGHTYQKNGLIGWKRCYICVPGPQNDLLTCQECEKPFEPTNKRGIKPKFCGNACKQKNYRARKVVTQLEV